ncbi:tubulin-like doman-containing protein [Clostridium botulinum]|uniref:tubulin-like doman-containing protein n=1 Tax=Clostridium botulinum TaxID=1491 RepID=UPI0019676EED
METINKRQILLIGCGKAGNRLVNELMLQDPRLTGLFVNTSYDDMANLKKCNEDNTFLFTSADGSGRNRNVAQQYVKDQIRSLIDTITGYPLHNNIYIVTSADGGTGSGITPMICQLLRTAFKTKKLDRKINLIAVMPSVKIDDKLAFENALGFWNDIVMKRKDKAGNEFSIKDECLDNIKLINNTKCNNYEEINKKAVRDIINSFNMNGTHDEGDIDDRDSKTFNTEKGFSLILTLPNGYKDAKEAVDFAIKDSVFALPDNYNCNYIGLSLNEEDYMLDEVRVCFDVVYKTTYKTYNTLKHNTIVLSGCSAPNEVIASIKQKLDELNTKQSNQNVEDKDLTVSLKTTINKSNTKKTEEDKPTFTESDLDDIASAVMDMF